MEVRNINYNELNEIETLIINKYYAECKKDYEKNNSDEYYKTVNDFWENQRGDLTYSEDNKLYNGWVYI